MTDDRGRSRTLDRLPPLGLADTLSISAGLADATMAGESLTDAAGRVGRYLYKSLRDAATGESRLQHVRGYVSRAGGQAELVSTVGTPASESPPSVAGPLVQALSSPPSTAAPPGVLRMVSPTGYAVACIEDVGTAGTLLGIGVRGSRDTVVALDLHARASVSSAAAEAFAAVAAGLKLAMTPHLSAHEGLLRAENAALRELIEVRHRVAMRWARNLEQAAEAKQGASEAADLVASYERFAHIARTLHRSLLPPILPPAQGIELGSVFHPSWSGRDVSGDFYDVIPLGRGDLLFGLGDVCGKGAEAAAITAIMRHTIRAVAPDMRHPCQILRRLNDVMLGHDLGERFCSVVLARVTPIVSGVRLSVCCAGHVRPVVVRADGRIERVGVDGTLLGLFPDIRLYEETVQLHAGDMIVSFTDGVTEATRHGEEFGEERAERILAGCVGTSATEAVDTLLDEVLRHGGQSSRDDIAILALRVPLG